MKRILICLLILIPFFCSCAEEIVDLPGNNTRTWTIIYYNDADNNLESYLMYDLNEMEGVNIAENKVNVVALVDRIDGYWSGDGNWTNTRAFLLGQDGGYDENLNYDVTEQIAIPELSLPISGVELNMGDQDTLEKFITFCINNYPADHYMLLLSNHGGGWRDKNPMKTTSNRSVCWDETNGGDYLEMKEVRQAIENSMGANKIDIVAFDACLMGMVEIAYELKDVANILVASAESVPGFGYPYTQIWGKIRKSDDVSPEFFAETIISQYIAAYKNGDNVEYPGATTESTTMSAIDLSKMENLKDAINDLAAEIISEGRNCMNEREETLSYAIYENVELWDFCDNVASKYTNAAAVKNAIDNTVIVEKNGSNYEKHHGLAIYFPKLPTAYEAYPPSEYITENIKFAEDAPNWVSLVNTGLVVDTGNDTYETLSDGGYTGNNTKDAAQYNTNNHLSDETTVNDTYIVYSGDVDYWYAETGIGANITVDVTVPTNKDYEVQLFGLYEETGSYYTTMVDGSYGYYDEQVTYDDTSGNKYLGYIVKVYGFSNYYDYNNPYTITANW